MTKVLLVARWEFVRTVTRRSYIIVVAAMPLFYGALLIVGALAGRTLARQAGARSVAIVDHAHILDLQLASRLAAQAAAARGTAVEIDRSPIPAAAERLVAYDDEQTALAALRSGAVVGVYVIAADYLSTGAMTSYSRDVGLFALPAERSRQGQVGDAIRASQLGAVASGDQLTRVYAPTAHLTRLHIDQRGGVTPGDGAAAALGPFAGAFGVYVLLAMSVFFSAGYLQQATVEDRQSRMIEILMSSLDADELLRGKIIGLAGAGLLQVAIYVGLLIVPGMTLLAIFQVPIASLALSLLYFALGYTLFACLMACTGAVGRTAQEGAQLSAIWTLAAASPMGFVTSISTAPNGLLARALSFFPLTSPVTMMLRLSSGDVPAVDIAVSIAITIAAIYGALRAASKLFRVAALMYGTRATLPSLIRILRAEKRV